MIPPKGKYMLGTVKMDAARRIPLPEKACKLFEITKEDELLVLGEEGEGIALIKKKDFLEKMAHCYDLLKEKR